MNTSQERRHFDQAMQELFVLESSEARSCFTYLQRLLYQFKLSKAYEVKDILVEIYARGVKRIEGGESINIPYAWIKRVGLNVIREFRREAERLHYYDFDSQPQLVQISDDLLSKFVFQNDLKAMQIAFRQLSLKDQNLLYLRIVNELSWGKIAEILASNGDSNNLSPSTLRQRGSRALYKLHKLYKVVREDFRFDLSETGYIDQLDDEPVEQHSLMLNQTALHLD
jgi:DNA-directed RNA polymerase specialized sigma24 family protein